MAPLPGRCLHKGGRHAHQARAIGACGLRPAPRSGRRAGAHRHAAKIKSSGAITLGYRESSIPFSSYDNNQKVVGCAMDLCCRIVDAVKSDLKMDKPEVKLNPVTSATRIPLVANGTVDLECGSTTNDSERARQVAFTITHFVTTDTFVSKKSADLKTLDDLRGKTIVSTSGTTNIKEITELNAQRHLGLNILAANDHAEAFLMVETGRAAAFVMDDILLYGLVATSKGARRLRDLRRGALGPAVRDHAAPRRPGVQESGRCGDDRNLQERRDQRHLRQVVPQADPAARRHSQRADERRLQEGRRQPDRHRRPGLVQAVTSLRRRRERLSPGICRRGRKRRAALDRHAGGAELRVTVTAASP